MTKSRTPKPPITMTPARVSTSIEVLLAESVRQLTLAALGAGDGHGYENGEALVRAAEILECDLGRTLVAS